MFKISTDVLSGEAKGFHLVFANGFTASVQWGRGNYADRLENGGAANAEVAAWGPDENWWHAPGFDYHGDDVLGNVTSDEVVRFLQEVANAR